MVDTPSLPKISTSTSFPPFAAASTTTQSFPPTPTSANANVDNPFETPSKMKRKRTNESGMMEDDDEDDDGMNGIYHQFGNIGDTANGEDQSDERVVKVSRTKSPPPTSLPLPLSTASSFIGSGFGLNGITSTTPSSAYQSALPSPFVTPGSATGFGSGPSPGNVMNGLNGHGHSLNGINGSGIGNGIERIDDSGMMIDGVAAQSGDGNGMDVDMAMGGGGMDQRGRDVASTPDYFSHPLSVQAFTTTLHPPEPKVGLLQPQTPLEGDGRGFNSPGLERDGLRAVQEARNVHGPLPIEKSPGSVNHLIARFQQASESDARQKERSDRLSVGTGKVSSRWSIGNGANAPVASASSTPSSGDEKPLWMVEKEKRDAEKRLSEGGRHDEVLGAKVETAKDVDAPPAKDSTSSYAAEGSNPKLAVSPAKSVAKSVTKSPMNGSTSVSVPPIPPSMLVKPDDPDVERATSPARPASSAADTPPSTIQLTVASASQPTTIPTELKSASLQRTTPARSQSNSTTDTKISTSTTSNIKASIATGNTTTTPKQMSSTTASTSQYISPHKSRSQPATVRAPTRSNAANSSSRRLSSQRPSPMFASPIRPHPTASPSRATPLRPQGTDTPHSTATSSQPQVPIRLQHTGTPTSAIPRSGLYAPTASSLAKAKDRETVAVSAGNKENRSAKNSSVAAGSRTTPLRGRVSSSSKPTLTATTVSATVPNSPGSPLSSLPDGRKYPTSPTPTSAGRSSSTSLNRSSGKVNVPGKRKSLVGIGMMPKKKDIEQHEAEESVTQSLENVKATPATSPHAKTDNNVPPSKDTEIVPPAPRSVDSDETKHSHLEKTETGRV